MNPKVPVQPANPPSPPLQPLTVDPCRQNLFHAAASNTLVTFNPMHLGALPAPECVCGINTNISQADRLRKVDALVPGASEHECVCVRVLCGLHPGDEQ